MPVNGKSTRTIVISILLAFTVVAPAQQLSWEQRFAASDGGDDIAGPIARDAQGHIYASSTQEYGWTIMKYARSSQLLWRATLAATYPTGFLESPRALVVDSNGAVTAAISEAIPYSYRARIVTYDADGNLLWDDRFPGPFGRALVTDIAIASNDDRIVVGLYDNYFQSGGLSARAWIRRYAPNGQLRWEKILDEPRRPYAPDQIALDAAGMIYTAGATYAPGSTAATAWGLWKLNSAGGVVWHAMAGEGDSSYYRRTAFAVDANGTVLVTGTTPNDLGGEYFRVWGVNSLGQTLFDNVVDDSTSGYGARIAVDEQQRFLVLGAADQRVILMRMHTDGARDWTWRQEDADGYRFPARVTPNSSGGALVMFYGDHYTPTPDPKFVFGIERIDDLGESVWQTEIPTLYNLTPGEYGALESSEPDRIVVHATLRRDTAYGDDLTRVVDADGETISTQLFDSSVSHQGATGAILRPDGGILVAAAGPIDGVNSATLLSYDAVGNLSWTGQVRSAARWSYLIPAAITPDGGALAIGRNDDRDQSQAVLLRFDAHGVETSRVGLASSAEYFDEATLHPLPRPDGGFDVLLPDAMSAGQPYALASFGADGAEQSRVPLESLPSDARLSQTRRGADGAIYLGGVMTVDTNPRLIVAKFNPAGVRIWYRLISVPGAGVYLTEFAVLPDGGLAIIGNAGGSSFAIRTLPTGVPRWTKTSGPGISYRSIASSVSDDLFLAGSYATDDYADSGLFLAKLAGADGHDLWTARYDSSATSDDAEYVVALPDGGAAVSGTSGVNINVYQFDALTLIYDAAGRLRGGLRYGSGRNAAVLPAYLASGPDNKLFQVVTSSAQDSDALPGTSVNTLALRITSRALLGDANCDDRVDNFDIDAFVLALIDRDAWQSQFPQCPATNLDLNLNGAVDNADVDPFVKLLTVGQLP